MKIKVNASVLISGIHSGCISNVYWYEYPIHAFRYIVSVSVLTIYNILVYRTLTYSNQNAGCINIRIEQSKRAPKQIDSIQNKCTAVVQWTVNKGHIHNWKNGLRSIFTFAFFFSEGLEFSFLINSESHILYTLRIYQLNTSKLTFQW